MKIKKTIALLLACCMILALAACGTEKDSDSESTDAGSNSGASGSTSAAGDEGGTPESKTLVVASTNDVTMNFANDGNTYNVFGNCLCYDYLSYPNQYSGERESCILESWTNADKMLTLKLKEGVTFTDGTPLTGEDVIWTYKRYVDAGTAGESLLVFDWENAAVSDDGFTVTLPTFDDYAPGISALDDYVIVCQAYQEAHPVDDESWFTTVQGTGPYYCAEQVSGVSSTYKLRDNYWGDEKFAYDTIVIKFYSDNTAMAIDMEDGKVDIVQELDTFTYEQIQNGAIENVTAKKMLEGNVAMFGVNSEKVKAWQDVRVRQAFAMAIDYDAIGIAGFGGLYERVDSLYPSSCIGYVSNPWEHNVEKAKQLMEEAGYGDGLTLKFCTRDRYADAAEVLQGQLAQIGVTLDMEITDGMTMFQRFGSEEIDCGMGIWMTDGSGEPSGIYNTAVDSNSKYIYRVLDKEWNELIVKCNTETDEAARIELLKELQQNYHDNIWQIVLLDHAKAWSYNADELGEDFELFRGGVPLGLRFIYE